MRFVNATVVGPGDVFSGHAVVENGVIVAAGPGALSGNSALDFGGDYLLPGLVELHTDHLESHLQPRPGVEWPALPALVAHDLQCVAAGITTVLDSVCVGELHESRNRSKMLKISLDAIDRARALGVLRADHGLHLRCEISDPRVLDMFEPLAGLTGLKLVSLMDHTPGQRQFVSDAQFRKYYKSKHLVWNEDEYESYRTQLIERQAAHAPKNRAAIVNACRTRGVALASHDDTTTEHVAEAQADGVAVSEFPTTVEAAAACKRAGVAVMAGGPNLVCGRSHSGNVSAMELARQGLVDVLSSDYVPASLLLGAFLIHEQADVPLNEAVALVTGAPAKAVGLDDRGRIEPGKRADLLRVALVDGRPVVKAVWREGRQVL